MTEVKLINSRITSSGLPANSGIHLWLTQTMGLVYKEDWNWAYGYGRTVIYTFKDEKMATVFALRWS